MIKKSGIDFANLPEEDFDEMLGESTGAAVIFGVTGGVMEAALRTAYEVITGQKLEKLEFTDVRGLEGVKEASYNLNGLDSRWPWRIPRARLRASWTRCVPARRVTRLSRSWAARAAA